MPSEFRTAGAQCNSGVHSAAMGLPPKEVKHSSNKCANTTVWYVKRGGIGKKCSLL